MMKNLIFLLATVFGITNTIVAMQVLSKIKMSPLAKFYHKNSQDTVDVSLRCAENIDHINNDLGTLRYYFQGVFNQMAKQARPQGKPSHIVQYFRDESNINKITQLRYASATDYMHMFLSDEKYKELDDAFEQKYKETNNIAQTWEWFDEYFKDEVLVKSSAQYKFDLVEQDKKIREYAAKGIFFSNDGKTVVLDPSRATSRG